MYLDVFVEQKEPILKTKQIYLQLDAVLCSVKISTHYFGIIIHMLASLKQPTVSLFHNGKDKNYADD